MEKYKEEFIEFMLECGVLTFGDFTAKSGRKTPFFVNTGNYKTGKQLKKLGEYYAYAIKEKFGDTFDILFGPAYKGIPLCVTTAIALSDLFDIDVIYSSNRKELKDHGDKGIFLGGTIKSGDKVVIIEDVTTAGTSIYETMDIFESHGDINLIGLIISVDRMEKGRGNQSALAELKEKFGFDTLSIVTMQEVIEYLYNRQINGKIIIGSELKEKIDDYYDIYGIK